MQILTLVLLFGTALSLCAPSYHYDAPCSKDPKCRLVGEAHGQAVYFVNETKNEQVIQFDGRRWCQYYLQRKERVCEPRECLEDVDLIALDLLHKSLEGKPMGRNPIYTQKGDKAVLDLSSLELKDLGQKIPKLQEVKPEEEYVVN